MESVEERITELESKISNLELLINERFSEVMSAFNKFSESRDKSEGEESGVKSVGEASGNKNAGPTNSPEMESKQPSEGTSTHFPNFYTRFDKKLEMPTYDGEGDPTTWVFQVERYFGVNKLSELEKVEVLDGEVADPRGVEDGARFECVAAALGKKKKVRVMASACLGRRKNDNKGAKVEEDKVLIRVYCWASAENYFKWTVGCQ